MPVPSLPFAVRRTLRPLVLLLTGLVVGSAGGAVLAAADPGAPAAPGPARLALEERPIIVGVEGDAANGFGIDFADGTSIYPPTDSEALAECGEYDRRAQRIRCRVEVRTWYRDLGDLQRSLDWVRAHG